MESLEHSVHEILIGQASTLRVVFVLAKRCNRQQVVSIINEVSAERIYLQTDQYRSTEVWERLLEEGYNFRDRFALFVVKYKQVIIGFGRLSPDLRQPLSGNVGIVLVRAFRSMGIGSALLQLLIDLAIQLGYNKMTADVLATNARSVKLFRRFQFVERDIHDFIPFDSPRKIQEITFELDLQTRKV